ncbi:hypothetical protein SRHO_G00194940 [Serrasalmus rhombeus]
MGILITKSAPDAQSHLSKKAIPGRVGMNIIGQCYQELFLQHGQAHFEVSDVQQAGKVWQQALFECQNLKRISQDGRIGLVRVQRGPAVRVPAGAMMLVPVSCHEGLGIEEYLDALSGAKWFSTLDLASGYNQVPVAEEDKEKTPLGHLFVCVETDPEKVKVVADWKCPTSLKELRSFLEFASYYRRFVEGFAKLAAPLHRLVGALQGSKKQPKPRLHGMLTSHWDEACEASFQALKDRLVSAPVLGYADFASPFILEIDASHAGLGAVLSQDQGGQRRLIAFAR